MCYGHICTNEDFFIDAFPLPEDECPICCQITTSRAGWIGVMCDECRTVYSSEDWYGSIVTKRRELLKLNRKEMGKLTGYSPKTIKQYEWVKCSKKYYERTKEIMIIVKSIEKRKILRKKEDFMPKQGLVSDLVGMYLFKIEDNKIVKKAFINGMADKEHFIVQAIEALTGSPNVAKLMTVEELENWVIIPTRELAEKILDDYEKNGWRYSF